MPMLAWPRHHLTSRTNDCVILLDGRTRINNEIREAKKLKYPTAEYATEILGNWVWWKRRYRCTHGDWMSQVQDQTGHSLKAIRKFCVCSKITVLNWKQQPRSVHRPHELTCAFVPLTENLVKVNKLLFFLMSHKESQLWCEKTQGETLIMGVLAPHRINSDVTWSIFYSTILGQIMAIMGNP